MLRSKPAFSSQVFLVYGRNRNAREILTALLHQFGLSVLDWEGAVALTGKAAPHAREILEVALKNVGAVVVLMTGDEEARLLPQFCGDGEATTEGALNAQSRPNVIFEAGLAFGLFPSQTVVVQLGRLRAISDLAGVQYVPLDESPESRRALANRLRTAGCTITDSASKTLALPESEAGLPAVSDRERSGLKVFRTLKGLFRMPGFGGSLEVAETAKAGEKLTLSLELSPETLEYRVCHWLPGAVDAIELQSGVRTGDAVEVSIELSGPAGVHLFDLLTRANGQFVVAARARCAVSDD